PLAPEAARRAPPRSPRYARGLRRAETLFDRPPQVLLDARRRVGLTLRTRMTPTEENDDIDRANDRDTNARARRPEEQDPKLWKADGWTARVIKNEDDDGWAVEMTCDG